MNLENNCEHKFCANASEYQTTIHLNKIITIHLCDNCYDKIDRIANEIADLTGCLETFPIIHPMTEWQFPPEMLYLSFKPLLHLMKFLLELLEQLDIALTYTWVGVEPLEDAIKAVQLNISQINNLDSREFLER